MVHKYTIGYTTGVFDLFHIGHLNILSRAKEQCDVLVVGVSTDELVQSYKHKSPIIPFEERKAIVEAIRHVDRVVVQHHRDKYKAWEEIRFDAMFVGDDWKNTPLYQKLEQDFKQVGVDLVYFPYTRDTSSTVLANVLTMLQQHTGVSNPDIPLS